MKRLDLPVQMLCLFTEKGDVSPVRFRFEDISGKQYVCKVRQIVNIKHSELAGIETVTFQCVVQMAHRLVTLWLRYTVKSRKWILLGTEA